ncbi:hypothetical protein [Dactylosporangium sp. CA-139066]|uniref:hypothetical protein n=1 Tax=Dactylosporangium sp. CA-139066 TaxID=3239930 RepID=UPI003D9313D3
MLRRLSTLAAGLVVAGAAALSFASPAQASTVDLTFGPLSIGEYCHAQVSSSALIGLYESAGLRCYSGSNVYVGTGDAYLACKYLTTDVVMAALRGPSNALVCRVIR